MFVHVSTRGEPVPEGDVIEQLYDRAAGRLGAYGYLLTGSQSAGEELAQAAIVKVFVRRRRLDNVAMAEAYVRTTMRNLHVDRLRREKTWRRIVPGQATPEHGPDSVETIASRDAIGRALGSLPNQVRTAVVLRYLDDLTVGEVAAEMRLAEGTVKRYLSDGRALLAPLLGTDVDDPATRVAIVGRARR